MSCRQAVRHWTLTPASVGSNPTSSVKNGLSMNKIDRPFFYYFRYLAFCIQKEYN